MSYNPNRISEVGSLEELREFVQNELEKISKEFNETIALDLRAVSQEPKRPREGMIVSADGTDWNPGSGAGAYEYVGGLWRRVAGLQAADYGDIVVDGSGNMAIDNNAVTLAKMADIATARFLGRVTAGTGDPEALTGTQATTLLDLFTNTLKGLVPLSGGGTTNFLRADGTWNAPPSGGLTALGSGAATSGSTVSITGLGTSHKALLIGYRDIQHNSGSAQIHRMAFSSNNGSSYGTPVNMFSTGLLGTVSGNGVTLVTRTEQSSLFPYMASWIGQILGGIDAAASGPINAIQFSWAAGDYDGANGMFWIYGLN